MQTLYQTTNKPISLAVKALWTSATNNASEVKLVCK